MMENAVKMFLAMIVLHAVGDYPLQGDFLARAKSSTTPIDGVPWWIPMSAHCIIHAGSVYLVTGSIALSTAEFVVHFITDDMKCRGDISFLVDQALHIAAKAVWAVSACVVAP